MRNKYAVLTLCHLIIINVIVWFGYFCPVERFSINGYVIEPHYGGMLAFSLWIGVGTLFVSILSDFATYTYYLFKKEKTRDI